MMSALYKLIIFVVFVNLIVTTTSIVFNANCVAPSPCTCSSTSIHCDSKNLSVVPVFSGHSGQHSAITLYMQYNHLTSLPAYAFQILSSIKASKINIYLSNNQIVNIEQHAFSGLETAVWYLNLEDNNLTHLPLALGELSSLTDLRLLGNPLVSIDAAVLAKISSKLKTFSFSVGKFKRFPNELNVLTQLSTLTIYNVQGPNVHSVAFPGFENNLVSLDMSHAEFESIPLAVCRLKSLATFTSNYSPNFGKYNASIFDKCTHPMTTVTYLALNFDHLKIFPNLSNIFPNLHAAHFSYNSLSFIDTTTFTCMSYLTRLYIGFNRFTSVPSAINKATNLQLIHAYYNQIHTVEDFDFLQLHNITQINLAGNPLVYLSPSAFAHNPLLKYVKLESTEIGHIPRALLGLQHLNTFWLSGKPTDCDCGTMSYLKQWNVSAITIHATCSSGKPVKTFLTTDLPKCS